MIILLQKTIRKQAMTFQAGQSGNPKGRTKGSPNKRTELAKLLEPHAEKLVSKIIALALEGDVNALRLCIERLIPKVQYKATGIELPTKLTPNNMNQLRDEILRAAFAGHISTEDAERLKKMISDQPNNHTSLTITTNDPIEAARIYQQIMTTT